MPRATAANKDTSKFSRDDLIYLTALFESTTQGFKSRGTIGATFIAPINSTWTNVMAKEFGGTSSDFRSAKGKPYMGWYTTLEQRLAIVKAIEKSGLAKGTLPTDFDKITV